MTKNRMSYFTIQHPKLNTINLTILKEWYKERLALD